MVVNRKFLAVAISSFISLLGLNFSVYASQAKSFKIGSFDVTPSLGINATFTDNLLYSDDYKIETWVIKTAPLIEIKQKKNLDSYVFNYQIENVHNTDSSKDDHVNHRVLGSVFLDLDTRHRLKLDSSFNALNEERGTDFSLGYGEVLKEPTPYTEFSFGSHYSYGSRTALANIDGYFNFEQIEYDRLTLDDLNVNFEFDPSDPLFPIDLTGFDITGDREYKSYNFGAKFFYNSQSFSRLNFELGTTKFDYETPRLVNGDLDSRSTYVFVGGEWQNSAMTTGFAKLGYSKKEFDDASIKGSSGFRWKVGVLFSPLTYSNFDFSTSKEVTETKGLTNFIENTNVNFSWHHQWLERLATNIRYSRNDDEYGGSVRDDENKIISATVDYKMRRNINILVTYSNVDRNSTFETFQYQGNNLSVDLNLSF